MTMSDRKFWEAYMAGDKRKGDSSELQQIPQRERGRNRGGGSNNGDNFKEEYVTNAIDVKDTVMKYASFIQKLEENKIDVSGFLSKVSPDAIVKILSLMNSGSEKVQLDAAKDILDRAGHSKVNKVAMAGTLDPQASKAELISTVLGLSKKTGELDIVEDDEASADEE
jgi:hypothetical protein